MTAIPTEQSEGDIGRLRLKLGSCLPASCVEHNSSRLLKSVLRLVANTAHGLNVKVYDAVSRRRVFCRPMNRTPFSSAQIVVLILICSLIVLVLAGTISEYRMSMMEEKRRMEKRIQRMLEAVSEKESLAVDSTQTTASVDWLDSVKSQIDLESVISFKSQESLRRSIRRLRWWLRLVTAFSVRMNVGWLTSNQRTMLNGERPCNRITCLYGIRVITMLWVILGHSYVFSMFHLSNLVEATESMPAQFLSQVILNASLSVDTFFLISGLLNCYMWCIRQKNDKERGCNRLSTWLAYYWHRYIRLAPPYILVIAVVKSGLYSNLGTGPAWDPGTISGIQCDRNTWWRHLLFLNNLVPGGERCLPWMWHLAIDMQCFILAPLFIIVLWKHPKLGCALVIVTVLVSALTRGLVIGLLRLPTNLMLFLPRQHFYAYFDLIYQKPYFRCGPYLIGLLTGWLLATKTDQLRMWHRLNWKTKLAIWVLVVGFCLWPVFGLYPLLNPAFSSPVYNGIFAAVNRTMWSVGVAMVIVSCHCRFGCAYLNSIFSWIGWWPFARLNYGVYLMHELLVVYVYFNRQFPIMYDGHASILAHFAFFAAVSYALSLVLFIIAEGPTLAAERLLFRRKPGSRKKHDRRRKRELPLVPDGQNENVEDVIGDRQRMTERWSAFVAACQRKSAPSGVELYKATELSTVDEEPTSVSVKAADASVEASIDTDEKQKSESEHGSLIVSPPKEIAPENTN